MCMYLHIWLIFFFIVKEIELNILLTKTDPEYREVSMKWVELNQDEYQDLLCKKLIFNNFLF